MDRAALIAAMHASPLEVRPVTVPGWGVLHVRELTTDTVDRINRAKGGEGDGGVNALALSAAATICDEGGTLLFDLANADDIALLCAQGFAKLSLVLKAANKIGDDAEGASGEKPGPAAQVPARPGDRAGQHRGRTGKGAA